MALGCRDLHKREVREGFLEVERELDLERGAEFGLIRRWSRVYHVEKKFR